MSETKDAPQSTEAVARRMAHIFGASSASAKAVANLDERRSRGEAASIFWIPTESMWLVGPPPQRPTSEAQ